MASRSFNNSGESVLADHDALEESYPGRFPRHPNVAGIEYREVNVDQLSESDFEGVMDSGLAYSDHDYIGSNPDAKVPHETSQFPVMGGVTDQYLNGETNDPCAERSDNRAAGVPSSAASGSFLRKPQHPGGTTFRAVKGNDFVQSGPPQQPYSQGKLVTFKNVTQLKKSGRPPKNEAREVAGDRLMGRAMVKAGIQTPHGHIQPHHSQLLLHQAMHARQEHCLNFRGAAPMVTPARGQKITPRGRTGLRRDASDDGVMVYTMPTQQPTPNRILSPKKMAHFRSAQAAEDAHSREMMEAAQNALAPSNVSIPGMMSVQSPHEETIIPLHNQHQLPSHHLQEGDLPRTPGKGHSYTPISSPQPGGFRRASSESQEIDIHMLQQPIRTNPDGLPVTPGRDLKTPGRSRMSFSESTESQSSSPRRPIILSPPRPQVVQSRLPSSPHSQRHHMMPGGHLKSPTIGPNVYLAQGPSTMASVQMLMSSNASMPSLQKQIEPAMVHGRDNLGKSPIRSFYDPMGAEALISGSGSTTYTPRRRKEKEADEDVEAAVTRNLKTILRAEKKTPRLHSTSSDTVSPRNDVSDEDIIHQSRGAIQTVHERKRTANKRKDDKSIAEQVSSDESADEKWVISCICGQKEDDGEAMVGCDQCIVRWEHVDCIFPRTKKAPTGLYFCHVCKPRPTELTPEQARAYQDRVKRQKDESNNQDLRRKLAERVKRKEENSRKSTSLIRNTPKQAASKIDKSVNSSYREIEKNEYSTNAKRFLTVSRLPASSQSSNADILKILRSNPRARSLIVEPNIYGIVTLEEISEGDYISELCGFVSLQKECMHRDPIPGSFNDNTFLFQIDDYKIIIDARKCGNFAKNLRKSCKPNAELEAIMSGSELHIMVKATEKVRMHDEVSIKLEDDWMIKPMPTQRCGCDKEREKEKGTCELERFFKKAKNNAPYSSRKSVPAFGTTLKAGRSSIPRAVTETKAKISNAKKVKRKGSIKLPRYSRSSKGGSGGRKGGSTEDESERGDEETGKEKEYEMSIGDEKDKEDSEDITTRRKRKNTESIREMKERRVDIANANIDDGNTDISIATPMRSTRIRKNTELAINHDRNEKRSNLNIIQSDFVGLRKNVKNDMEQERKEIQKEGESLSIKKAKKPWPVMNYSLPSERNKPSREDRKLQAMCERLEKEKKSHGSTPRGRPSNTKEEEIEKKARESGRSAKEEKSQSNSRGKRKTEDEAANADSFSSASTLIIPLSTKRLSAREARKGGSSPVSSHTSSHMHSMIEETSTIRSTSLTGKKKMLHKHQQAEKEGDEEAAAAANIVKRKDCFVSAHSTPTRSKKLNKKEERGAVEALTNMEVEEKSGGEGHRQEMRKHAVLLRESLPATDFSLSGMGVVRRDNACTTTALLPLSLSSPPVHSVPTPMGSEKIVKKSASVSYEEYKKRKKTGESGEEKNEKKEELPKKSFMPRVDASVYVPPSLPNVTLPGLEEEVGLDELKRRVYDDSPRGEGGVSLSIGKNSMGKPEPTPKRQSINDRLKNEFALPILSSPPSLAPPWTSSTVAAASTPSISSLPNGGQLTPTGGRTHKNRLSDTRAPNMDPPGLIECPRPTSLDISSTPDQIPSKTSVTSSGAASFLQRVASIRSSK